MVAAFAGDETALRVDEQAIGDVAVLAKGAELAAAVELHDALRDHVGEVDVAVLVDGGSFSERDDGGDVGLLGEGSRRQEGKQGDKRCELHAADYRPDSGRSSFVAGLDGDADKLRRADAVDIGGDGIVSDGEFGDSDVDIEDAGG